MTRLFVLALLVLSSVLTVSAQKSKAQLEKERRENQKKISEAQKILKETETEKRATMGQLKALNRQIKVRKRLISAINQEIKMTSGEISDLAIVTESMEADLVALKKEYAEMIYDAYKANHAYDKLTFLFSAETFNQLFRRLKYLEQYAAARERQVEQIEVVRNALTAQREDLIVKKKTQHQLLESKVKENKDLVTLKTKHDEVVKDLGQREKELQKELAQRKAAINKLDKLIANIVKKEIKKSNKGKESDHIALTVDGAKLSKMFEGKKNKHKWPVGTGFVSEKFGKQPHPVLKGIMIENQGIDIQTQKGADVKCIFDGKVATTAFVPGMNSVVIVQHGDYYTLYAKLKEVNVKKGQVVKANQSVGTVFTDGEGETELQFQVWKNTAKLDPEKWLLDK